MNLELTFMCGLENPDGASLPCVPVHRKLESVSVLPFDLISSLPVSHLCKVWYNRLLYLLVITFLFSFKNKYKKIPVVLIGRGISFSSLFLEGYLF